MAKAGFSKQELGLVGTAALLVFSRVFGLSLVLPNFRSHYEAELLVDAVWIGTAFGAHGLTMALMQLPNGMLSDRFGRRPLLVAATLFFVGGSVMAAFADDIGTLIAARLLQGMGAVASVAMAAVGETITSDRRTTAMAMVGIPAGAGFLLGMAAGPLLFPLVGMQGLFLITAGIGLLAGLPLLRWRGVSGPPAPSVPVRLAWPVLALALGGFATNYTLTTTLFFLPDDDWRVLAPMLLVALVAIGGISRAVDRAGWTWQPVAFALAFVGGAAALFALGPSPWWWLAGGVFFILHSTLATTLPSNVSRISGPAGGRGHGMQNIIAYGGTFAAGPVAGLLVGSPWIALVITAAVAVLAAVLVLVALRAVHPKPSS